ncbi:MAG: CDP-diacylglycerol--glycerol-3-phosphate 3-phosphatidyltransferase [Clostridia bacterium]
MNLANKITVLRILLVPVFMFFAVPAYSFYPAGLSAFLNTHGMPIAIAVFIIASITDTIDGHLARKLNQVTVLGKFLDPVADKLLVIAALVVLVERLELSSWVAMIIITREILIMAVKTIAAGKGIIIAASIWAKVKTILQIIAVVAIMAGSIINLWILPDILLFIAVLATIYSGIDYLWKNIHIMSDGP